jgi:hypothetical protein
MANMLTKEGDLDGRKMSLTCFGSNCPYRVNGLLSQSINKFWGSSSCGMNLVHRAFNTQI